MTTPKESREAGAAQSTSDADTLRATDTSVPGVDHATVTAFFEKEVPDVELPLTLRPLTIGNSNITCQVGDAGGRKWVLRRPPLGKVASRAHDVGREYRILRALSDVYPAPNPVAFVDDTSILGAPFYVMDFVDGLILETREQAELAFTEDQSRRASSDALDKLLELHTLDPVSVGLGDLGQGTDYVKRQLQTWRKQLPHESDRNADQLDETYEKLMESAPPQQGTAFVHGDFKFDNIIFSPEGRVRTVLDWELCTLGDPLCDLATLVMLRTPDGEVDAFGRAPASSARGMLSGAGLLERYADHSPYDLASFDFYLAFVNWRAACVLEGVHARAVRAATGRRSEQKIELLRTAGINFAATSRALLTGSTT